MPGCCAASPAASSRPSVMTTARTVPLLLIRHGATAWTAEGRYQGRQDTALSAQGRADAVRLALHLRDADIGLVISSPLARARETAAPIADAARAPLKLDERLVELDFGHWQGLTQPQVKAQWPDELRNWKRAKANARPFGGESMEELQRRVEDFLRTFEAPEGGAVAIVAHAWVVRVATLSLNGESLARVRDLAVPPASIHLARLAVSTVRRPYHEAILGSE